MSSDESLPSGWSFIRIEELRAPGEYTFVGGPFGSDLTARDYVPAPGVPVIRGVNLGGAEDRFVDEDFVFVSDKKAKKLVRNLAFPGDLVFTQRGTLGQVAVIPQTARFDRYVISQSQMKLTPDPSRAESRFLYHYFRAPRTRRRLLSRTQATGVPHINLGILKSFGVAVPSLPEQRRIADVLDRAEALRAKRRAALAKLDAFTQSIFFELFGDGRDRRFPTEKLSDCAEIVSGVAKGRKLNGGPIVQAPYLRVANVQAGFLDLTEVKSIDALPSEIEELRLLSGDVVLTEGGDFDKLGRGAMWNGEIPGCIHQNHVFRVRVWSEVLQPRFFHEFLQTRAAKAYFLRCAKRTTNLASINMTQLRALPIPLPPPSLQNEFAERAAAVERLKATQQASLAKLDELFASLQDRAFRGEL